MNETTFTANTDRDTTRPDVVSAGSVMELHATVDTGGMNGMNGMNGSAAWFQDCKFDNHCNMTPSEVSIESELCDVFSNTELPFLRDLQTSSDVTPEPLDTESGEAPSAVFAAVEDNGASFLRWSDAVFQGIMWEHTALTVAVPTNSSSTVAQVEWEQAPVPEPEQFAVLPSSSGLEKLPSPAPGPVLNGDGIEIPASPGPVLATAVGNSTEQDDPAASPNSQTSDLEDQNPGEFWTKRTVAGFSTGGALGVLAVCVACICFRKWSKRDKVSVAHSQRPFMCVSCILITSECPNSMSLHVRQGMCGTQA